MVRVVLSAFLSVLPVLVAGIHPSPQSAPGPPQEDRLADLLVDRGEDALPLRIPADEDLGYKIFLDLPVFGRSAVGTFRLRSKVEPYMQGLPRSGEDRSVRGLVGEIRGEARGSYLSFTLDQDFVIRALPQDWPAVVFRDIKRGSSGRKRELRYGLMDGEPTAWFRRDTHCKGCKQKEHFVEGGFFSRDHHCKKCKRTSHRVWKKPETRAVPPGALDTLSAIFLSRSMAREGLDSIRFPLLKKSEVWSLEMKCGKTGQIEVPAGAFQCREIKFLAVAALDDDSGKKFESLFGMEGVVHIWLEERSGVPILIAGTLPLGALDVELTIELDTFAGTPPGLIAR